jgi:hypothetical protein
MLGDKPDKPFSSDLPPYLWSSSHQCATEQKNEELNRLVAQTCSHYTPLPQVVKSHLFISALIKVAAPAQSPTRIPKSGDDNPLR